MKAFRLLFIVFISANPDIYSQSSLAKYGNEILGVGGGARALAMGSAYTGLANDVTAAYWNVAGLSSIKTPEIIYMHSERFDGIVGYDYGAIAFPLQENRGVLGVSFFRQGVDGIANTLNAWDTEKNRPVQDEELVITTFSATDLAFLVSFAKQLPSNLSVGFSAKIIHQRLGPFANAWGYSLDAGIKYKTSFMDIGASVHDLTTMQKIWSVSEDEFEGFQETFNDSIPSGENEFVLPSVRLGASKSLSINDFDFAVATDLVLFFDNRQTYYLNLSSMSIEPHIGAEVSYKKRLAARFGLTDFIDDPVSGFSLSPTFGLGLHVKSFDLDYGFAGLAGTSSALGYTHRISLTVKLKRKH